MNTELRSKINVAFSEKFWNAIKDKAAKDYDMDGSEKGFSIETTAENQEFDVEKDTLYLTYVGPAEQYFSISFKINGDMYAFMADRCIKKLNKMKALLEAAS